MKYNVIQSANGNTTIVSEWDDNPNGAKSAFHGTCRNLYSDPNTTRATVAIFDENLNVVDNNKEYINKAANIYTVVFNSHGGSNVDPQTIIPGNLIVEPENPTREGYTFTGWELDGYTYDFTTPVYKDVVLVATWEKE